MSEKKKRGIVSLLRTTLAVVTASLTSLSNSHGKEKSSEIYPLEEGFKDAIPLKRSLRPQLVLRLNMVNPENSIMSMHSSHRSHSSHSSHSSHYSGSHSSHASHASHYSHYSSSTYSPSSPPVTTPSGSTSSGSGTTYSGSSSSRISGSSTRGGSYSTPSSRPKSTGTNYANKVEESYSSVNSIVDSTVTLTRVLTKGCKGYDVMYVQRLLLIEGAYDVIPDGDFGEMTEVAVKKFQRLNALVADGKVGNHTLLILKHKVNGN
jgi:hypothetical protein